MTRTMLLATRLAILLRDYGYRIHGNRITRIGTPGFSSDQFAGYHRSPWDAAEQLIPIISDQVFSDRLDRIRRS